MDSATEPFLDNPYLFDNFGLGAPELEFDSRLFWASLDQDVPGDGQRE